MAWPSATRDCALCIGWGHAVCDGWREMPRLSVMQAVTPSLVCLDTHTSDSTPAGYTKGLLWWRCRVLLRSRWRWRVLATAAVIGTVNSQ